MAKFGPNVFRSVKEFLNPENHPIKMLEMPPSLNSLASEGVIVIAVMPCISLPFLNTKQIAVYRMLKAAEETGRLKGIKYLVDSSSGNFAWSLGMVTRTKIFGDDVEAVVVVPKDIPPGKLSLIRSTGATCIVDDNGMEKALELGNGDGFLYLRQYENEENPNGNELLARRIFEETNKLITVCCAGLGSSGTTLGLRHGFDKIAPNVKVVGVACVDAVSGVRNWKKLEKVTLPWKKEVDFFEEIEAREAHKISARIQEICGAPVGPSSGLTKAGLDNFFAKHRENLDQFRNKEGEVVAAFICADTYLPYLPEYGW